MIPVELKKNERDTVLNILELYLPNHDVYAFGSRVTGNSKPFSDLDLVVLTDKPISVISMYHLNIAFEESTLPFKVDIVDWSAISDEFKKIIQNKWVQIKGHSTP